MLTGLLELLRLGSDITIPVAVGWVWYCCTFCHPQHPMLSVAYVTLPSQCHKDSRGRLSFPNDTNVTPNKLASTVSSEIIQPSPREICHSKSKKAFTEVSLIHLKYHSTGKGENHHRTWNTKGEKKRSYIWRNVFATFYQKVEFYQGFHLSQKTQINTFSKFW